MNNHQHRNKILEELQKKHLRQASSSSSVVNSSTSSSSSIIGSGTIGLGSSSGSSINPLGSISSVTPVIQNTGVPISSSSIVSNGIVLASNGLGPSGQIIPGLATSGSVPTDHTVPTKPAQFLSNPNSFGYFISQDSPFGNNILPILPRF